MTEPDPAFDLAGGEVPSPESAKTLDEVIAESRSRRNHRTAAAILVYVVVAGLLVCLGLLVVALIVDIGNAKPAAVAMAASMIFAISVLTTALAKYAFGMNGATEAGQGKDGKEAATTPSLEAVKTLGDILSKLADVLKGLKP